MQFSVSFDTANSPDLGGLTATQQQEVLDTVNAAAAIWASYLTPTNVTLNIGVAINAGALTSNELAEGGPRGFVSTHTTFNGQTVYEPDTTYELQTGQNLHGSSPDLEITLTPNVIASLLYFTTDPKASVPSNLYDALSVFEHEIGHGLGILSVAGDTSFPGTTVYDTFISNNSFLGRNAELAYATSILGNPGSLTPVPLQPGSLSHVSESSNLGSDLMSPNASPGVYDGVSAVDLGILQDIGVPLANPIIDKPPVVTTANVTLTMGQMVALSSLFTVSDPYGSPIQLYQLWDSTRDPSSGHFVVGGTAQPAGTVINVTAAQLAQTYFAAGTVGDNLQIRAWDGYAWSAGATDAWAPFTVSVVAAPPPVVTTANVTLIRGQTVALSSLFSVSDPNSRAITEYQLWDSTGDPNSGHFVVNGVAEPASTVITITAAQLAQTNFVAGTVGDNLQIRAYDGLSWSAADTVAWSPFTVSVIYPRPVVATSNLTLPVDQSVSLSNLFMVSDPNGQAITEYQLWDSTRDPNSGHFVVNGVVQPAGAVIDITAAQLAQTSFFTGVDPAQLQIRAYDGLSWSAADTVAWSPFTVTPVNSPPVVTASNVTEPTDTALSISSLFSVSDPNGLPITEYQIELQQGVIDSGGALLLGGVVQQQYGTVDIPASELSQLSFVTATYGTDHILVRAFDGVNWSSSSITNATSFAVSLSGQQDHRPELTLGTRNAQGNFTGPLGTYNAAQRNETLQTSNFSFTWDADGDPITEYQVINTTTDPNSGHWVVNGVAQANGVALTLTPAQWAQTIFVTGTVTANVQMRVSDGKEWSATPFPPYNWIPGDIEWGALTITVPDNPPVVTTANLTVHHNQSLTLAQLASVSDPDGDPITKYQLLDTTTDANGGHFMVNGVAQANATAITVMPTDTVTFQAGTVAADLQVRAFDGTDWSAADNAAWSPFTVSVLPNSPPVVTTANISAARGQTLALSSLFSVSDADGDAMTQYQLWDSTGDPNSGFFVVNGVVQPAHSVITVTAAQLAQTSFVTGRVGDSLQIRASDGIAWSAADNAAWSPFTVSVPADNPPVVTTGPVTAQHFQTLALSSLASVSDADGDAVTEYQLWDSTADPNSGHLVVNGVVEPAHTVIDITAAQAAQTYFVTGSVGANLQIRASDGIAWSAADNANWSPFTITVPPDHPPVVTTADVSATPGQTLALSSLFSVSDADGDAMTKYELWDSTGDPNSGHFVVNGAAQPAHTVIDITAAQLAQTSFLTGSVGDALQIRAFDGISWSAGDTAAWSPFHINIS